MSWNSNTSPGIRVLSDLIGSRAAIYLTAEGFVLGVNPHGQQIFQLLPSPTSPLTWKKLLADNGFSDTDRECIENLILGKAVNPVFLSTGKQYKVTYTQVAHLNILPCQGVLLWDTYEEIGKTYLPNHDLQYRLLFENMNSAFALHEIILDQEQHPVDYRFLEANPVFEQLTGLKAENLIGRRVLEVLPQTETYWIETYGKVALEGIPIEYENYSHELQRYYQVKAYSPMKGFFAVTFFDITQRMLSERHLKEQNEEYLAVNEELTESLDRIQGINEKLERANKEILDKENQLSAIFQTAPVLMILLDESIHIQEINRPEMLGLDYSRPWKQQEQGIGDVLQCLHATEGAKGCGSSGFCNSCAIRRMAEQTLHSGKPQVKQEVTLPVLSKGKILNRTVLISSAPIVSHQAVNVLVTIDDISERKQIEIDLLRAKEEAVRSDQLKNSFLANMSHEIRTPLNGIVGFTELLVTRDDLDENLRRRYGEIIAKSSEGLMHIIDDILDISRIESGNLEIVKKPLVLGDFLADLDALFGKQYAASGKKLVYTVQGKESTRVLNTDEDRLRQIFSNLLDNALKFSHQGHINFGIHQEDRNRITFFVRDTGIGIPHEQHPYIFDRFRQGDIQINRVYGGNGLGLAIVKHLCQLLDCKLWFESAPGEGSCFYFAFETDDAIENLPITYKYMESASPANGSLRLLLVEDDEINLVFLEEILREHPYELVSVTNGQAAVDAVRNQHFDAVLMDIQMPVLNGYEATRLIREFNQEVYIIAQTAYAMKHDDQKAFEAGCDAYITKPIKRDVLLKKLENISRRTKQQRF